MSVNKIIIWTIRLALVGGLIWILGLPNIAQAQAEDPDYPIYVVQEGDNFWTIAQRFNVTIDAITTANNIEDPNQLRVGMELKIPGISGVTGRLITERVPFGEDLTSLSRRYQFPVPTLARLNRLVSPASLYIGRNLVLTERQETNEGNQNLSKTWLNPNQSVLELALIHKENPWEILDVNGFDASWQALPQDVLLTRGEGKNIFPGGLPPQVEEAEVLTIPLGQGKTTTIRFTLNPSSHTKQDLIAISGEFIGKRIHFYKESDREGKEVWVALQGIHNQVEPGFYPLAVTFDFSEGNPYTFNQMVFVRDSGYLFERLTITDQSLIDPANTQPEEDEIVKYTTQFSEEKLWQGKFRSPVAPEFTDCWPSTFGRRRSYNGSAFTYIHSGLDFCGQTGHKIFAPAKGKVVYTGSFFVRGNTTIIDHGWGVFTLYAHQSEIEVNVGDIVEPGQVIGLVGNTGRVTGPHLHWEVWVGGVQVDPYDWILNEYPSPKQSMEQE